MRPVFASLVSLAIVLPPATASERGPAPRETSAEAEAPLPAGAVARLGSGRFRHEGYPLAPVAFSADGRRLASTHTRGVSVFDAATGRLACDLRAPDGHDPTAARFLADGRSVLTGEPAGQLALVEVATGGERASFRVPARSCRSPSRRTGRGPCRAARAARCTSGT